MGTLAGRTAQALRQRGITSVTLAYDDTLFGNDRWPQGIAELDTDHLYYAPDSFHGRGRRQELERDRSGQS